MKTTSTFLLILLFHQLYSQQEYIISGYVSDSTSAERLIGVNIYVPGTSIGTTTNTYGFYSLSVMDTTLTLAVSYVGYVPRQFNLKKRKDHISKDISLLPDDVELEEVEVVAEQIAAVKPQMSTVRLSAAEIKRIPAFLGEVDVIKAIQLLPGVQSGGEGTNGFYVRGGSPDQNLILLDGVPVYNASHLFGFFSVFNADAIKNVQLTKGGFPARFGGRLSSVLEIDLKEGNMKEFHGEGSIGIVATKFTLEGPIKKDRTSFIISGRRTYIDLLMQPFLSEPGMKFGYYFGDLNVKLNHVYSRKDRLYLSYYTGLDKFYQSEEFSGFGSEEKSSSSLKWGNHTGSVRWNHLFNERLFGNLTATFTQYRFSVGNESSSEYNFQGARVTQSSEYEYYSFIRDYGLRYDLQYSWNNDHTIRTGLNYTFHTFKPGVVQSRDALMGHQRDSLLNLSNPIYAHDISAYVEDDWQISHQWRANLGLHYSVYTTGDAFYNLLQPRGSVRYLINDEWSLKASYALMNQYIHLLSNSGLGLPTDLWVSSTQKVKPQLSQQIAIGSSRNFKGSAYEFSAEIYYKWMSNLIEYKEGAFFLSTTDWQNTVETDGRGTSYGLELMARKNEGKTTGWIGYTLAWNYRQFGNLNFGERFPYKYDRRHDISIVINHKFSEKFDVGATWVFGTGNSFTAPVAEYFLRDPFYPMPISEYDRFTDRNALRYPAYHRLDIGVNFHKETSWGRRTWNISVYNAYNRRNPYFLQIVSDFETGEMVVEQVSLFPIIPSISYIFSF